MSRPVVDGSAPVPQSRPGSPSRRAFLCRAAAFVASVPLLGMVSHVGPARAAAPALRATTTSLTVGLPADPASLNPLIQTGLVEASVQMNVFDTLAFPDADGVARPALAESWEVLDDTTWEFRLRSGVRFHNGEPFDSSAVRFTVETMLDPATASPVRAQLSAIDRVETPDPLVARIVTRQPFAPLLSELTALAMLPPAHTAAVGMSGLDRQPIGTGPYRLTERVRDERIVLEANGEHWRGAPAIDRVELRPIPDGFTRVAALRTGQVGLSTNVPLQNTDEISRDGLQMLARPGIQTLYVRLNARRPPLDNVLVRRAVASALQVDAMLAAVYGAHARRVTAPFPPDVLGYDTSVQPTPYDPDLSRSLLAQAGLADGFTVTLEAPQGRYPGDAQIPQIVAGYLKAVGITANVRTIEWATYLQKVTAGQGEDLFLLAGTNRTFDPHFTMARLYANTSSFGRDYYGNAEIDPLITEAAATLDRGRREAIYHRVLDILRRDVPAIWLAQLDDLYGARADLDWQPRADSLLWLGEASIGS
ncbi:MAG: ABC transporter substrate-binding protein [Chloroflexota bacterium]